MNDMDMDPIKAAAIAALVEKMARGAKRQRNTPPTLPIAEAMVSTLKELAEEYAAGNRFKVGDIVAARKGRNMRYAGWPAIVIEIADPPIRNYALDSDAAGAGWGRRLDVRVAQYTRGGHISYFWSESHDFESWDGKVPDKESDYAIDDED